MAALPAWSLALLPGDHRTACQQRQAAGSAETGHTQALALRQGLLAVEAEEEQLREALGQEWTHELYSPASPPLVSLQLEAGVNARHHFQSYPQ